MKFSIAITLAAAKLISAHATFQSFVVDGEDQGQHFAVRTPSNYNNPIYDVTSSAMVCNGGEATSDYVEVAAGATIGLQWVKPMGARVIGCLRLMLTLQLITLGGTITIR
jgi:hypothetical protein